MHEIIGDYDSVVANINRGLTAAGVELGELALLDHLCYRTESLERYQQVVEQFSALGKNMGEVEVKGRPISVVALNKPLETGGWTIPFLEIASPKVGSPYPEGLEHAEFVTVKLLEDFASQHAELNFITDAMNRTINPELKYRQDGISVKFHQLSIGSVVKIEEKLAL